MNRNMVLPLGKVENHILRDIVFNNISFRHPAVIDRAKVGDDCASIRFNEGLCVVSTDPITAAVSQIGGLSINISCNDIATRGVRPIGITLAIMLPEGSTLGELEQIMKDAGRVAYENKVEIIGGHTEVTSVVNSPVIVSTAIGYQKEEKTEDPEENDIILMTKSVGIEGTGILACDKSELEDILTEDELKEAKSFINNTSVISEGELAGKSGFIKMHDVTEGGLLGGLWEICEALEIGCEIDRSKVIVAPVTMKVAKYFDIDYMKLISSGAMLIVLKENSLATLSDKLRESGIDFSIIGKVKNKSFGKKIIMEDGRIEDIEPPVKDELYKAL